MSRFIKFNSADDKTVFINIAGAFIVKGFAFFITLYTLPAYISYFNNNEVLGLWFTILSLLNWILNFDLGIGNGLRNYLSESIALNNKDETKKYISSAYISIGVIVILSCIAFSLIAKHIDFNTLLNIDTDIVSSKALWISAIIVFVGVMLQFWFKLISSILYALQLSSLNNFLVLCTNVLILLYVIVAPSGDNDANIIEMSIVHAIAVLIPLVISSLYVFKKHLQYAVPNIKYFKMSYMHKVLNLGGLFFIIQIAYMIIMSTNEIIITRTSSNADNIEYQAYYKLFSLGSTIFALTLTPIWSIVTKAKAQQNIKWIQKIYYKFIGLAFVFSLMEVVIIFCTRPLMNIWLGENVASSIDINMYTGILFAIFASAMMFVSVLSSIANGLGNLKTQFWCYSIGATIKIPLSILFINACNEWHGVMIANIICMLLYCLVEPFVLNRYFKNQHN